MNSYPTNAGVEPEEGSLSIWPLPAEAAGAQAAISNIPTNEPTPGRQESEKRPLTATETVFFSNLPWRPGYVEGQNVDYVPSGSYGDFIATIATAFLANVVAGNCMFGKGRRKIILGLFETPSIDVCRTNANPDWRQGSLEAQLLRRGNASQIVFDWLAAKSLDPIGPKAKPMLVLFEALGLVTPRRIEHRLFGINLWTDSLYVLEEEGQAVLNERRDDLLEMRRWRSQHGELFQILIQDINHAVSRQTESSD